MKNYNELPAIHREFLHSSMEKLKNDTRILGVAAGGSFILKTMDEYSDLDLVLIIDPDHYNVVLKERKSIAQKIGPLSGIIYR